MSESKTEAQISLPLLPLRDVVVYPNMVMPLFVGRELSIAALDAAMGSNKQIFLVAQKSPEHENPGADDVYEHGCVASVLQLLKLPDGTVKVLVEGQYRAAMTSSEERQGYVLAHVEESHTEFLEEREADILSRSLTTQFEHFVKLSRKVPPEVIASTQSIEEPGRLTDTIAAHLTMALEDKQKILEFKSLRSRIELILAYLESEIDLLQIERRIRGRVKKQMEKTQREYYLNEQMKAIQKELGELDEHVSEFDQLQAKIEEAGMPTEAKAKANAELNKMKQMSPMSSEATVVRSYVEWLVQLPWKKKSKVSIDLPKAEELLNKEHYGLAEVKDRILEYLAVQSRVKKIRGPVLCLVGPPGVGKTSLGQSIAKAINRQFSRLALGGVRDEAEIRGHRRTYIGSMPGKVIQKMSKVGVKNPLILLDEIDKMGSDMRGDPAAALLEVLDPEQNSSFNDHYLEVDYDLSDVMFVCTSNSMDIPGPLLDRMEVIRIPGYTEDEKVNIAQQYLLPKQFKNNGVLENELVVEESAIRSLIRYYTKEAGVRSLEREIAKLCRKVVKKELLENPARAKSKGKKVASAILEPIHITDANIEDFSGVKKFNYGRAEELDRVGQVTGLAWTSVGGDLLVIEAAALKGKGKSIQTGSLGDVMQESITAAMTVVRSRAEELGVPLDFHENQDIHIHVPEGATPKDGPSAGIAMCTAVASVLTKIPVKANVAMTGEITLRGQVLPIGGLKEKLLAAHRGGITTVIIPKENESDLKEVPDNVKTALDIHCVSKIEEVLALALVKAPVPHSMKE
ncbi:MAG: endopeptidase La [Pseudomonadota bacterium]|nr:endopeptidase La [Pseudomonadota bacterium]|tara:strand:- start:18661 stop:21054 length:2394 start_codon:yes stop_codon:yes gene_type:complete